MAEKSGLVENHNLVVQGKLRVIENNVYIEEVLGVGDVSLTSLLESFDGDAVRITVAKKNIIVKEETDEEIEY